MICVCKLGLLIQGTITQQMTLVFAVIGALSLLSAPVLLFVFPTPSPLAHSVEMLFHISANYNLRQRLPKFFCKGQGRMQSSQGSSCLYFCSYYFTVRDYTSPNAMLHRESASSALSCFLQDETLNGYRRKSTGASGRIRVHLDTAPFPHRRIYSPSRGAILVPLLCF